jgi:GntR family transcriptional regulator/MocR family aminotransferase
VDPLFEIGIEPAAKGARTTTQGLYRQLRAAIADGRLAVGVKLPPTRRAEVFFGVSRNTVAEAYSRLMSEGYIVSRRGAGTFVADRPPPVPATSAPESTYRLNPFWLREDVGAAMNFWQDRDAPATPVLVDFRPALIDSRLFPHEAFRRVTAHQLRGLERKPPNLRSPQGNQGHFHLREAIARHIAVTRAVVVGGGDILVTAGAQQGFDLLARILVTPGETVVAVEDPGYPPLRVAFAAAGARVVPVAVDDEGLVVGDLPPGVNVICVTPSHQFPLGMTMSPSRRQALAAFARAHGAVIVEDDYDGEFRYDGAPLAALRTADAADIVFYVGSFSKCLLSSLRLGFVVAPAWALPALVAAKNAADWHCPVPLQKGVAAFIGEGLLDRHIRKMRMLYRRRRDVLTGLLERDFAQELTPVLSRYGMHVAAIADPSLDVEAAAVRVARQGVRLHTLKRYHLGRPAWQGLVFGLGTADEAQIRDGLGVLREGLNVQTRTSPWV